ncbi:MAG: histidine phosphatase family protein [Phocaeicola sp.]|nr:histidine phosphatase family protein [Phocaeicola sp.]
MITVYLVRHGQTEENLMHIFQGHLPGKLTEEGREQARMLGGELQNLNINCIVSSDLQRVVDTVNIAMDVAVKYRELPWEKTTLLREIDWGKWTGVLINSVNIKNLPDDAETREMLYDRAGRFVEYLKSNYRDRCVLVVAHGQINRSIEAQISGIGVDSLRSIPHMKNAEMRKFVIDD